MENASPVHAVLLTAPGCPYCPQVLAALKDCLQTGILADLEVIDIATDLERAGQYGVRSAPWFKLNSLEFDGAYSADEIRYWVERASQPDAEINFLDYLLGDGKLARAEQFLRRHPHYLQALIPLFIEEDRRINVRIGVGALLEGMQDSGELQRLVDDLGELIQHQNVSIRIDACHYLSLTDSASAIPYLQQALKDNNDEVRETAAESLQVLGEVTDATT